MIKLIKKTKDKIRYFLARQLLKIINNESTLNILSDKIFASSNTKKIGNCLQQVTIGKNSSFLPEASVENMTMDITKINVGDNTHIRAELVAYSYGGKIAIGNNCYIGAGTRLWSGDSITVGNNVLIGHNINIIDFSHKAFSVERAESYRKLIKEGHPKEKGNIPSRPIVIEDDVIIYAGSNIMMGVTIGKGSIISAGSVVVKDVKPYSLVIGNPAKAVWKTK
jgi:acetyltransferase-like isoleucine patch superfamily enzyme